MRIGSVAKLAPIPPTSLTPTAKDYSVALDWADPGDPTITKFQYQRSGPRVPNDPWSMQFPDWTDIPGSEASTRSYTTTDLPAGRYVIKVRAELSDDSHGPTTGASATVTK